MAEENSQLAIPIVYGSMALWLGKKAEEKKYSYKWIVYIRGLHNEDISPFVQKVVFTLHNSFENPVREVTSFPFELREFGWGQFEIGIKLYLNEIPQPLEFFHFLKLYPTQPNAQQSTKKPVVSEFYDEIVVANCPQKLRLEVENVFTKGGIEEEETEGEKEIDPLLTELSLQEYKGYCLKFEPAAHKVLLEDALTFLRNEISTMKGKIKELDEKMAVFPSEESI